MKGSHKNRPSLKTTDHPNWKSEALAWRTWAVTQEEEIRQKIAETPIMSCCDQHFGNGYVAALKEVLGEEEGGV